MQREREREKKRGDIERITVERNTTQNTPTGKRERKKKEIQRGRAALIAEREEERETVKSLYKRLTEVVESPGD